jgi:hypothetical protein
LRPNGSLKLMRPWEFRYLWLLRQVSVGDKVSIASPAVS